MVEGVFNDLVGAFRSIFLSGDTIGLVIALGAVVVCSFLMKRGSQIGSMTLLALVLFAFGGFVRAVMRSPSGGDGVAGLGSRAARQVQASIDQFMSMTAGSLLVYFILFMLLIFIVFGVRSALSNGGGH